MLKVGIGHSMDPDAEDAAAELLEQVAAGLEGHVPKAGLLFVSSDYSPQPILDAILARHPGLELIGCTSGGEISSLQGYGELTVTFVCFASDNIEIRAGIGRGASLDPGKAAQQAAESALGGLSELAAVRFGITLPESISVNAAQLVAGLIGALGTHFPLFGGAAAQIVETAERYTPRQFFRNEVLTDSVPLLLFSGPVQFSFAVCSGWEPVSEHMMVTRAKGLEVVEIDGQKAGDAFSQYLGSPRGLFPIEYAMFPLAVTDEGSEGFFLRSPFSQDRETGSMQFLAPVEQGSSVRIAHAGRDQIIEAAGRAFSLARTRFGSGKPALGLLFSCAGRRFALGTRTAEEYVSVTEVSKGRFPLCGFYTFGEISPLAPEGKTLYHNCSFVTLLIGEADAG